MIATEMGTFWKTASDPSEPCLTHFSCAFLALYFFSAKFLHYIVWLTVIIRIKTMFDYYVLNIQIFDAQKLKFI